MPVNKKNGKWFAVINYVGLNGKYKKVQSKYFDTKREALDCEMMLRQKYKNTDKYSINFEQAYKEFRVWKENTIKIQSVRKLDDMFVHLEPLYKIKVEKLTLQQYKVFKEILDKKDFSVARKNKIHRFVCNIIDYCNMTYGIYNDIPRRCGGFKNDEIKKEMCFFTLEEFNMFIEQEYDLVYKTLFTLLFYNGLRIGEALALSWNDYKGGQINITKNLVVRVTGEKPFVSTPKTKNSIRHLPVNEQVENMLNELKEYYRKFPSFNENWFIFGGIKPLSETTITERKNINCDNANVKRIRLHDFRHSCASYYIKYKDAPIILISKLLGHSKISITLDTYSHLYPNELDNLMKN